MGRHNRSTWNFLKHCHLTCLSFQIEARRTIFRTRKLDLAL